MSTKNITDTDICYTGVGLLNKSGNHTQKQFLRVMKNNGANKTCSVYAKSLQCKSCKKVLAINTKAVKKWRKNKDDTFKMSKKTEKKYIKQRTLCEKCKNKNTKKCTLKNYLQYSGAEIGKCKV